MATIKSIEEIEFIETLETILDYKMKEAHKEQENHETIRDNAKERGDEDNANFFDQARSRDLARWSAFSEIYEAIQLYK